VAENRNQHFPVCGHAILADSMAVKLEHQLYVVVTKQGLYSFWIGSHGGSETMPDCYGELAVANHIGKTDSSACIVKKSA
jgi:hypothetical protein